MQNSNRLTENLLAWNAIKFYDEQEYTIYEEDAFGKKTDVCGMRTKLPQLIVKQWLSILLAEQPKLHPVNKRGEEDDVEINIDLNLVMHDVLAYGSAFVVPVLVDNKIVYDIKVEGKCTDLEYIEYLGELTYLSYSEECKTFDHEAKQDKTVTHKHMHIYNKGIYTYIIDDVATGRNVSRNEYTIDRMLPFKISNKAYGPYGKAIFYDAIPYIINFDNVFNSNVFDRDMSKPLLLIPDNLTKSELSVDDNGKPIVNNEYLGFKRFLRLMPSDDESGRLMPIEWRGNWNPEPYHKDQDINLHMISLHSGFGNKYLSFDGKSGFKTATEVVSEKDDLYKNKMLLDQVMAEIIYRARYAELILVDQDKTIKFEDVESSKVTFSDSIVTDDKAKQEQLYKDFVAGALTQAVYLELSGYDEELIKKVVASAADPIPEGS